MIACEKICFTFLLLCFWQVAICQQKITGVVIGRETQKPLPHVTVSLRNSKPQVKVLTDSVGRFQLTIPAATAKPVLTFSSVGFGHREISTGFDKPLRVVLEENVSNLDDVVVIGYQTVKRKDLASSVSSVSDKDLKDVPVNSAAEALVGRLAGVQITQSEGSPDAEFSVLIRGGGSVTQDNSPLYIIDGVQVEDGLASISPQDIASVDVLKDAASTAIYGARGANGVVLITTKSGKEGPTQVTYNGFVGVRKLARKLSVMTPYEFVNFQYERTRGTADTSVFSSRYGSFDSLGLYKNIAGSDWQDTMMGKNALMHTHNVGFYGGTRNTKFSGSYTYNGTEGIVLNSDYNRHLLNFKLDHSATNKLKLGLNARYARTTVFGVGTSDPDGASFNRLRNTIKYRPVGSVSEVINPNDDVDLDDENYFNETNVGNGLGIRGPVQQSNSMYRKVVTETFNYSGTIGYNFSNSFSFRALLGVNTNVAVSDNFNDKVYSTTVSSVYKSNTTNTTINQSNVLTYTNNLGKSEFSRKNKITVLLGQETYLSKTTGTYLRANSFPDGTSREVALNQMTLGTQLAGSPSFIDRRANLLSFFTRASYLYKNKYGLTLTGRTDGSSKFASANRWGFFPSAALTWSISREKFMQGISNTISDLKLRATYGISGNNRIADYLYFATFAPNGIYGLNESLTNIGYVSGDLPPNNLVWEKTISRNLGVDFGLFRNKLTVSFDIYRNSVRDALFYAPLPTNSGYTRQLRNTGSTLNQGLELQLSSMIVKSKNFSWDVSFNISTNKNTITGISNGQDSYLQNSGWGLFSNPADYIVKVGSPVGSMYGYTTEGFYQISDFNYDAATRRYTLKDGVVKPGAIGVAFPGQIKFKDIGGPDGKADGIIDDKDLGIIGNATPKFFGGLNQQFTYKNFDASVFVNFKVGNDVLNANKIEFTNDYARFTNMLSIMNNRFRHVDDNGKELITIAGSSVTGVAPEELAAANQNASIWKPLRSNISYAVHSWAIEDGSFLRINNITLGYTIGKSLLNKLKIKKFRVYGTLNNVALLTSYTGYDPEVNTRRATPVTPGVDYSAYPRSRSYIFGVNVTF
jgi:TonB-linked SusC/RagA family outer membrane protein